MAAVSPLPQKVTIDEAVEAVWTAVASGSFSNPHSAAAELLPKLALSKSDLTELAVEGLYHRSQHDQRLTRQASRPAIGFGAPHGKKWDSYVALTWPYQAADGSMKSLLDFRRADLVAFGAYAARLAQAYRRRHDWARATDALLVTHGVEVVRYLPAHVLKDVETAAREAMGRQE